MRGYELLGRYARARRDPGRADRGAARGLGRGAARLAAGHRRAVARQRLRGDPRARRRGALPARAAPRRRARSARSRSPTRASSARSRRRSRSPPRRCWPAASCGAGRRSRPSSAWRAAVSLVRAGAREWRTRFLVNAAGLRSDELDRMLGHDGFTVTPAARRADRLRQARAPARLAHRPRGADEGHEGRADRPDRVRQRDARADRRGRRAQGRHQLDGRRASTYLRAEGAAHHARAARAGGDGGLRRAARGDRARRLPGVDPRGRGLRLRRRHPLDRAVGLDGDRRARRAGCWPTPGCALSPRRDPAGELRDAEHRRGVRAARTPTPSGSPRDPDYGRIVCFCERVTRGEIRDALASPVPPVDLDGLRRRTRAHMGRCQGFFCGARARVAARAGGPRGDERRGRRRRPGRAGRGSRARPARRARRRRDRARARRGRHPAPRRASGLRAARPAPAAVAGPPTRAGSARSRARRAPSCGPRRWSRAGRPAARSS